MRHPHEFDDRLHEPAGPDPSWTHGEIDLAQERPTTALRADPSHRKWMLIGVGACALVTALAVLGLTRGDDSAQAADTPEPAPAQVQPVAPAEPAAAPSGEPAPAASPEASPKPRAQVDKPTFAASSPAAVAPAPVKKAPPAPAFAPAPAPSTSGAPSPSPSPSPSKPTPSAPSPTPSAPPSAPSLPAADQPAASPLSDLPDVEGWDEADAAAEQDEPAAPPAPTPSEPPELGEDVNAAV